MKSIVFLALALLLGHAEAIPTEHKKARDQRTQPARAVCTLHTPTARTWLFGWRQPAHLRSLLWPVVAGTDAGRCNQAPEGM